MSGSSSAERKRHEPLVLVETADLSEEDWLDYRRRGIGGSDVSAIFGTSPFRTARDLYYDKLNIASVEDDEGNWVAMEMGHLLEPLVAKIFERKTGYRVYQIKKMFQHPQYPWMLADVDYFVELPDGTTAILEIKTTNYNARDNWWMNGKETVPVYYESQGRHYMAVTDLDRCFFCCLYGNNEEEVIIREVKRDFEYEAEMVFLEQYFWENHVQRHVPPPYTESGALIIESARKHFGPADKNAPAVALDLDMTAKLMQYLRLLDEKKNAEVYSKEIDKDIQRLKALLIAEMGTSCTAVCEQEGVNYTVTYTPVRKSVIDKDTQLSHLFTQNRTLSLVYDFGVLEWFIRFYAEQAKKYRGKADLVLRTLMKLPYMNMKPDSREFSVLTKAGYRCDEIILANSLAVWADRLPDRLSSKSITAEKIATACGRMLLNAPRDLSEEFYEYLGWLFRFYNSFTVKYEGFQGLWEAVQYGLNPTAPKTLLWMNQTIQKDFPYRFDVFDSQYDDLAKKLERDNYMELFTLQMLHSRQAIPLKQWLSRYQELTGADYGEYFRSCRKNQ